MLATIENYFAHYFWLFPGVAESPQNTHWFGHTVVSRSSIHNFFLFTFCAVYRPDMPNRLPISDFVSGLVKNILRALKYWLHYTLVALAWLGVVPITACECRHFKGNKIVYYSEAGKK